MAVVSKETELCGSLLQTTAQRLIGAEQKHHQIRGANLNTAGEDNVISLCVSTVPIIDLLILDLLIVFDIDLL